MSGEDFLSDVSDSDDVDVIDVEPSSDSTVAYDNVGARDAGESSLVRPVDNIEEVVGVYDQFEDIKNKLLTDSDKQTIGSGKRKQTFVTKSGWRKIATAFNVSFYVSDKEKSVDDGVLTWRVEATAEAPNGKKASSWATCASNESNHMEYIGGNMKDVEQHKVYDVDDENVFKVDGSWRRLKSTKEVNEHDIMATAETRAKNRAISDLVGGGSVSAEEVSKDSVLE